MAEHRPDSKRWNHSIHYWRKLLEEVPEGARTALDVGTGEGFVARTLADRGLEVTGIDTDAPSLERAREQDQTRVTYLLGDVMTADLPREGFDVVAAVASVHHLDIDEGLARLADLTAPGGTLLIVGLAWSSWPVDMPRDIAAAVAEKPYRLFKGYWDHGSPTVWPPPHTFRDVIKAADSLPGSFYQRRLLYRYTLTWTKPTAEETRALPAAEPATD